jgi:hypothetical protein
MESGSNDIDPLEFIVTQAEFAKSDQELVPDENVLQLDQIPLFELRVSPPIVKVAVKEEPLQTKSLKNLAEALSPALYAVY